VSLTVINAACNCILLQGMKAVNTLIAIQTVNIAHCNSSRLVVNFIL